jgi:hypothetical protein
MNKVTKLGLTALCGSLVSVTAANAGAISIAGGAGVTWTTEEGTVDGNPIGMKSNLTFSAAGEMDNGNTWSAAMYNGDAQTLTSSNIKLTMGSMGSIEADFGAGGVGLDALDDKMPNAYEEPWDSGAGSGFTTVSGVHGSGTLQYSLPADILGAGSTLKIAYSPRVDGGGLQADKGNSGLVSAKGGGTDIVLTMAPAEGLSIFAGYSSIDGQTGSDDLQSHAYGATYAVGGITVGAQASRAYYDSHPAGSQAVTNYYDNVAYAVSFAVNDNLTLSYGAHDSDRDLLGANSAAVEMETASMQVSYNMGGATLAIAHTEVDNSAYSSGTNRDANVIALNLVF